VRGIVEEEIGIKNIVPQVFPDITVNSVSSGFNRSIDYRSSGVTELKKLPLCSLNSSIASGGGMKLCWCSGGTAEEFSIVVDPIQSKSFCHTLTPFTEKKAARGPGIGTHCVNGSGSNPAEVAREKPNFRV
jgi:hypothetical protein